MKVRLSIASTSILTEEISFIWQELSGILTTFLLLEGFWKTFFSLGESLKDIGMSVIRGYESSLESLLTGVSLREINSAGVLPHLKLDIV